MQHSRRVRVNYSPTLPVAHFRLLMVVHLVATRETLGSDPEGKKPLEKPPENPPENQLEISYTGKSQKNS